MDTQELLGLIRRRLVLLTSLTFLGVILSIFLTAKIVPQYESTATIFVSTPPSVSGLEATSNNKLGELATGNSFTQARVKSYATIVNNGATLLPVIDELGLKYDLKTLSQKVSATAPADTVLMYVSVIDPDPKLAATIANAVAERFSNTVLEIELNYAVDLNQLIKLSVVRLATVSEFPVQPNKRLNYLLGLFAGFALAFAISLLLRFLDQSLKSEKDIGETPLLGVVAYDPDATNSPLVIQLDTYAIRTEAFRLYRTNLLHRLDETKTNCVAVSSCYSEEGKTTSCLNLGFTIAQAGFRVIVVEGDMRRPSFLKYLMGYWPKVQSPTKGLSELLKTESRSQLQRNVNSAIHSLPDLKLDYILSGSIPTNPSELLGSERFIELIELLKQRYDYVFVDTPPVLSVADASIIARVTHQIVLVLHAGQTSKRNFEASRESMNGVGVTVTGVLLNKVPKYKAGDHYGYTYSDSRMGYYRYSYAYSPTELSDGPEIKKKLNGNAKSFRMLKASKLSTAKKPEEIGKDAHDEIEKFIAELKKR